MIVIRLPRLAGMAAVAVALYALAGCGIPPSKAPSPGSGAIAVSCGGKKVLRASGSSAQVDAMVEFTAAYGRACRGYGVDYSSNGSAAGRSEFISGAADFGATDSALGVEPGEAERARARCGGREAWNLPLVFGAIAVIYNLPGIDSLVLDAPTTAKIFNGVIRSWDAPEVAALNPGQPLPADPIAVVSRSDSSGTTDNFQRYLAAAAPTVWSHGAGETFKGVLGRTAAGNEGVWAAMRASAGSIAYTAWPFAKKNGLATADVVTSAGGEPVTLSAESLSKSIASVRITSPSNNLILDASAAYQPTQRGAYPIPIISYETVCSRYPDPETGLAVRNFLATAVSEGQSGLPADGYVPVPEPIRDRLTAAIAAIA